MYPQLHQYPISVPISASPPRSSISAYDSSSVNLAAALTPYRLIPSWHHHSHLTHVTIRRYVARHRSSIRRVAILWAMVLWWHRTCVSTSSRSAAAKAAYKGGYSHQPIFSLHGFIPSRNQDTLWWNPPSVCLILGVVIQVYDPNNRFSWTTVL